MRVRIVCYEDVNAWICGKFARKLNEELKALLVDSDIAGVSDPLADINHHIIYLGYDGVKNSIDTLMITHVDFIEKVDLLKKQLLTAEMGICMSSDTMHQLTAAGVPNEKLCYVNPAHDFIIKPQKTVIGITSKIFDDGRKNQDMLLKLSQQISPDEFLFKIMGTGWQAIVDVMRSNGFTVEYYSSFDYDMYTEMVPSFDYYLYFGFDEGSMGFLDAVAAGVQTIVTPQGFHLDAPGCITYPVKDLEDIVNAFNQIAEKKRLLVHAVSDWTWSNYARKHLEIWEYLLNNKSEQYFLANEGNFVDGLASIAASNKVTWDDKVRVTSGLMKNSLVLYFRTLTFKGFLRIFIPKPMRDVYTRCMQHLTCKK